jgi:HNH endonuclease
MIIGICGLAGSGKDTVADILVKHRQCVKVSFADPLKRICKDVFQFTDEQLWGPSEKRNAPDSRYPRTGRYIYPAAPVGALWLPISGGHTLIDEADLALVSQHKWLTNKKERGKKTSYVRLTDDSLKLHQLLMGEVPPGHVIDHINGDGTDNRRTNLRYCTHSENHANESKRSGGSSVFKGVGFDADRQKWSAKLMVNGETRNLGRFDLEVDAAMAYDKAAVEAFGEHARTNSSLFLTPRYALQQLGTNWGRNCFDTIWVDYALRVAKRILETPDRTVEFVNGYSPEVGAFFYGGGDRPKGVVIPDVRFKNEVKGIKAAGGKLIRVVRPGSGLKGTAAQHQSETEQLEIPDELFDFVLHNVGTLEVLERAVLRSWEGMTTGVWPPPSELEEQASAGITVDMLMGRSKA